MASIAEIFVKNTKFYVGLYCNKKVFMLKYIIRRWKDYGITNK